MNAMQRERLHSYMRALESRQRVAGIALKAFFVLFVTCVVLAFWMGLTGCAEIMFPPEFHPAGQSMESWMEQENVWPQQGCGKATRESEIPKLTEP